MKRPIVLGLAACATLLPSRLADTPVTEAPSPFVFFEHNVGQAPESVTAVGHAGLISAAFRSNSFQVLTPTHAVEFEFVHASPRARVEMSGQRSAHSNYFIGTDPDRWTMNVPHYERLTYKNIYDGIDVVFHGRNDRLEYDIVVAPGADPALFELRANTATTVNGDRVLIGDVILGALDVTSGNGRADWNLTDTTLTIDATHYGALPLVIDPTIEYATFAPSYTELALARDANGNLYVGGQASTNFFSTAGAAFEATLGGLDGMVLGLDRTGANLRFATYLGGNGSDQVRRLQADPVSGIVAAGVTASTDFPDTAPGEYGGGDDVFVARFSSNGDSLEMTGVLGGSADEVVRALAVASNREVYVGGTTPSPDYPVTVGSTLDTTFDAPSDGFVSRFDVNGLSLASTFWGDTVSALDFTDAEQLAVAGAGAVTTTSGAYKETADASVGGYISVMTRPLDELSGSTLVDGSSPPADLSWGDQGPWMLSTASQFSGLPVSGNALKSEIGAPPICMLFNSQTTCRPCCTRLTSEDRRLRYRLVR